MSLKVTKYLGNFNQKICYQEHSKVAQSGHTGWNIKYQSGHTGWNIKYQSAVKRVVKRKGNGVRREEKDEAASVAGFQNFFCLNAREQTMAKQFSANRGC